MKYILVAGGVISGIGKGIVASSIGTVLKAHGLKVTSIKIDPYINIDAGTFSPYEHGEVFVLDDGGEVDLDLGNYERFLDITLHKDNNITTGKIFQDVISKERRGDYLGKTVQVVPHITDAIQEWVIRVSKIPVDNSDQEPDVCIIELGGTIGDIESMSFMEAFRQFQFRVQHDNFCCVLVSLVPQPKDSGEQKTKPTQKTVRELRGLGLSPDLIFCRSLSKLTPQAVAKISDFCHVSANQVVSVPDVSSIYRVPLLLEEQKISQYFMERLKLEYLNPRPKRFLYKWKELAEKADHLTREVVICLVGKYTKLEDAYASVVKALNHAAMACNHKLILKYLEAADLENETKREDPVRYHEAWQILCSAHGVLIPGGFGVRGMEGKILAAGWARETKKPFLGICLGMQCAVIEYSRNVLNLKGANSTEVDPMTPHPVVIEMPEHHPGQLGGTMRLGKRRTVFKDDKSLLKKLYGDVEYIDERHRHRYEVNPEYVELLEKSGLHFVGKDEEGKRMEIMELQDQPYYVAVQYHPEYLTRPLKPSTPYLGFILASCNKLNIYLAQGCRLSPYVLEDNDESEDYCEEMMSLNLRNCWSSSSLGLVDHNDSSCNSISNTTTAAAAANTFSGLTTKTSGQVNLTCNNSNNSSSSSSGESSSTTTTKTTVVNGFYAGS
ncbi:hypothetical protein HELRODRAFT_113471 [Helobdella robusta]|uniref:CTP synthase n=1 Tax=Helobdella robusta TaxID=6412 RepID=T1EFS7_HELRO|nr:hypothetical protein HELRODRAFT_113471 [Helobdella robusta]ESO00100.1 hypothetical protein HELRODRAFT_113471 [Helobdella robusta]